MPIIQFEKWWDLRVAAVRTAIAKVREVDQTSESPEKTAPILRLRKIIDTQVDAKGSDRRTRGVKTTAEYVSDDGEVYRKAFWKRGTEPNVPLFGTIEQINAVRNQT